MPLNISIPQIGPKATTKDYVITILSYDWPLSVKKIHNILKKRYSKHVTYQAVYKTVQELVAQEVLNKNNEGYLINAKWLKNLHEFTEIVQSNYFTKTRTNMIGGMTNSRSSGNLNVLTFETWFDLEKFIYYLQKHHVMKSPKKGTLCVHHRHDWRPLFYMRPEYNWIKRLIDKKYEVYFMCANSSALDKWSAAFYKKQGIHVKNNAKCADTCELYVFGDYVIQAYIPPELQSRLDKACKKAKRIEDLDTAWLAENVFEFKTECQVVVNKDPKIAAQLTKQTISKFKR